MDDAAKRKCEEFLQRFDPDALYEGKTLSWLDEMRNNLRRIKGLAEWAPDDYDFVFKIYRHVAFFDKPAVHHVGSYGGGGASAS